MISLPTSLAHCAIPFGSGGKSSTSATTGSRAAITIVTAFFDLDRANWTRLDSDVSPKYQRSPEDYFVCFDRLAALRNPLVVFTAPQFAPRILESRRTRGLEDRTSIFTIEDFFAVPEVAAPLRAIRGALSDRYRGFLWRPSAPEFNKAEYVALVLLKSTFALTAIELGQVGARQLAWIDFGFVREPASVAGVDEWAFDFGDKINLFNFVQLEDDEPVYDIIRRADAYFMGGLVIAPVAAWADFQARLSRAFESLLACGLMDDEQTLMLMAHRAAPDAFTLRRHRPDGPLGWRFVFQDYREGKSPLNEDLSPIARKSQPDWFRTAKTAFRLRLNAILRRISQRTARSAPPVGRSE